MCSRVALIARMAVVGSVSVAVTRAYVPIGGSQERHDERTDEAASSDRLLGRSCR